MPTRLILQNVQDKKSGNRGMYTVPSQRTPEPSKTVANTRNTRWTVANHAR